MILYTDNQADNASITDSEATVNYPPSNVKDSRLSRIYKSSKSPNLDINAGGGLKNISDAYTNLVQDPCDLTTANWTTVNGLTLTSTSDTIKGCQLTKLESDGTSDPQLTQTSTLTVTANQKHTGSTIIRMGKYSGSGTCQFFLLLSGQNNQANINFASKTVTLGLGDKVSSKWYDDDTVEVWLTTNNLSSDTTLQYRIDPPTDSASGDFIYATACQLVDNTNAEYPFISGSKSADTITESFTMPGRFTFDMVVTPFFQFDATSNQFFMAWKIDGNTILQCRYNQANDIIRIFWQDQGGGAVALDSPVFDDGTSFVNINQKLRLIGSLDLVSGGQSDSRYILIQEDGTVNEDTQWTNPPDLKESTFNSLLIGHEDGSLQANSELEYLRIYEGLLVGDINSSSDVDALLEDKSLLFDKTYQRKITATDLLIANSTIRDGDTITLQANDVDSWGTGTPLYETVVWNKNIIRHNFTESSYQYWRLSVNSSNEIEIGRLYLGGRYQAPGVSPTVTQDYNSASVKSRSISGQSYQDTNYKYRIIGVRHPAMVFDDKAEFEKILDTIDIGTPFFVYFEESDDNCTDLQAYYVTIEGEGFRFTPLTNNQYHTLSYDLREEV